MGKNIYNKGCSEPVGGIPNCSGEHALLVSKMLGSAYDVVKYVAMNMNSIVKVSRDQEAIVILAENMEKLISIFEDRDAYVFLYENRENLIKVFEELDYIISISDNLPELLKVAKNVNEILQASIDALRYRDETEIIAEEIRDIGSDAVSQGNVPIYNTAVGVSSLNIPLAIRAIRTNGYYNEGDGGAALYKRVEVEPDHAGKIQSADGAWWEIIEGTKRSLNPSANSSTPKLLTVSIANNRMYLVTKNGRGNYVRHHLRYNIFSSGSGDAGGSSEVWRPTQSEYCRKVRVYKRFANSYSGNWADAVQAPFTDMFGDNITGGYSFWYRSSSNIGDSLTYKVTSSEYGKKSKVAFYVTPGSSDSVDIIVNGENTINVSLVSPSNTLKLVEVTLTNLGENTIEIVNNKSKFLYVIGVNMVDLDKYDGEEVTSYAYGIVGTRQYIVTEGSNDYAFRYHEDDIIFGTFHGGETKLKDASLIVDGDIVPIPSSNSDIVIGKSFVFTQLTKLEYKDAYLTCHRIDEFVQDGHYRLSCSMSGRAIVSRALTAMTCTNDLAVRIIEPFYQEGGSGNVNVGWVDKVTQQIPYVDSLGGLELTTKFTLYPPVGKQGINLVGPYIAYYPGQYNKLYYGPVLHHNCLITNLRFETERWFN